MDVCLVDCCLGGVWHAVPGDDSEGNVSGSIWWTLIASIMQKDCMQLEWLTSV